MDRARSRARLIVRPGRLIALLALLLMALPVTGTSHAALHLDALASASAECAAHGGHGHTLPPVPADPAAAGDATVCHADVFAHGAPSAVPGHALRIDIVSRLARAIAATERRPAPDTPPPRPASV